MWFDVEDRGAVRWLILNRPERKNAVPYNGWEELTQGLNDFEASAQRVLVITGRGETFCAGADLNPMGAAGLTSMGDRHRRMKLVAEAATTLHRLTKPTIAAVDGAAVGAGVNLAIGCDVVVATARARFAELFVRRGLAVDFGGTWLLPRLIGAQRAKELALSGRMVDAEEAFRIGLVTQVVDPERLDEEVTRMADGFLEGAPVAQMFTKQMIDRSWQLSLEEALSWEGQSQAICLSTEDFVEGVTAFLEKRRPGFKGK